MIVGVKIIINWLLCSSFEFTSTSLSVKDEYVNKPHGQILQCITYFLAIKKCRKSRNKTGNGKKIGDLGKIYGKSRISRKTLDMYYFKYFNLNTTNFYVKIPFHTFVPPYTCIGLYDSDLL